MPQRRSPAGTWVPPPGGGASPRCARSSDLLNSAGGPPEPQQPPPGEALPRSGISAPPPAGTGPHGPGSRKGRGAEGVNPVAGGCSALNPRSAAPGRGGGIQVARREARGACGPQAGSWGAARPVGGPGARGRAGDGGGRAASPGRSQRAARRGGRGAGGRAGERLRPRM